MPNWKLDDVRQGLGAAVQPQGFAPPLGGTAALPSAPVPQGASLGPIYDLHRRMQRTQRSAPAGWQERRAAAVAARNADKAAGRMATRAAAKSAADRTPRSTSEPPPWEGGPVPPSGGVIV